MTRKDLFRVAARSRLLEHPEHWFEHHRARNAAAHTYRKENAELALVRARILIGDVRTLLANLSRDD